MISTIKITVPKKCGTNIDVFQKHFLKANGKQKSAYLISHCLVYKVGFRFYLL